jgi:hypothetical protein
VSDDYLDESMTWWPGRANGFWSDSTNVIIVAGGVVLAPPRLTCGIRGTVTNLSDDDTRAEMADDEVEPGPKALAWHLCTGAATQRLKAPSTAEIPCSPAVWG